MSALLRGARSRAPAPVRGPAGLFRGRDAFIRGGAVLRLFAGSLPSAASFRHRQLPELFATGRTGPRGQPKKSRAVEQIVALRKRNYSVYEISQALKEQGTPLSVTAVREVLADEGFAPLPRRLDEERPQRVGPNAEAV